MFKAKAIELSSISIFLHRLCCLPQPSLKFWIINGVHHVIWSPYPNSNLIYSTTPPPTPRRSTVSTARNTALNVCVDISSLWDSTAIVVQSVFSRKVTLEWSSHQVDWIGISGQTIGRNNIIDSTTELTYSKIPLQWKLFKGAHSKWSNFLPSILYGLSVIFGSSLLRLKQNGQLPLKINFIASKLSCSVISNYAIHHRIPTDSQSISTQLEVFF